MLLSLWRNQIGMLKFSQKGSLASIICWPTISNFKVEHIVQTEMLRNIHAQVGVCHNDHQCTQSKVLVKVHKQEKTIRILNHPTRSQYQSLDSACHKVVRMVHSK
jgi:hypothetical protein